jgi:hypothetical protein
MPTVEERTMPSFAAACRLGAAAVVTGLLAAAVPASAEIEKLMQHCDGKLCPFFRASITLPDGWVEDKEAADYFKAQMLPKGVDFEQAPAKIYAVVRFNPDKQPMADFLPASIKEWRSRAKDAKISKLADLARDGKPSFVRHQFEARDLKEQGYELRSVTTDQDKDGNEFIVTITLSANSKPALKAAEPAYLAILGRY